MKKCTWFIFTAIIIHILTDLSNAQCLKRYSINDMVEVPIIYEFRNNEFRAELIYESMNLRLNMNNHLYDDPDKFRIYNNKAEFTFCIDASKMPPVGSKFIIEYAHKSASVKVRPITWKNTEFKRDGKILRDGKMSPIYFLMQPDPDWPILQSARLLRGTEEGTWILEFIINNKSNQEVALEYINLEASHPGPGSEFVSCGIGDPVETLTLNWDRIIHGLNNEAWTKFKDEQIAVTVKYQGRGYCSPYRFLAAVPIQTIVSAKQITRTTLVLKELPVRKDRQTFLKNRRSGSMEDLLSFPPPPLGSWKEISLSLNPSVFPRRVEITR